MLSYSQTQSLANLLKVKVNNTNLFISTKQGIGKHETNVFVVYNLTMKSEVYKWINGFYAKEFRKGKSAVILALVLRVNPESEYSKSI